LPYRSVGGQEWSRYAARRRFSCNGRIGPGGHSFSRNDGDAPPHPGGQQGCKTGPGNRRYALHVLSGKGGTGAYQCGPLYEGSQGERGKAGGGSKGRPAGQGNGRGRDSGPGASWSYSSERCAIWRFQG